MTDVTTLNEVADHPHEQAAPDHRTPLQRQEDEDAAAFDALPKARKIARLVSEALAEARTQVEHNAPITQSIIDKLEAIRALVS